MMNKRPYKIFYLILLVWQFPALTTAEGRVHEYTLENGLRLIVKEDHRAPVAISQLWYKVGGSYEQEGKTGLSHLLEHMMFQGTENYSAEEFSRIMAVNGAEENAFTGDDFTAYYQTLEKSRLAVSFELEADRMRNLLLDPEEFKKEKAVVMEERRYRTDDRPESLAHEHFIATAYQTSPYQHPIIGWMSDLQNLTLDDLKHWYRQWYAPNNATLVVAGDVDPEQVLALARKYYGPLSASEPPPILQRPEVPQLGMKRVTIKRPAKLPYLFMGYKVPSLNTLEAAQHWKVYALEVIAWILDGGGSARLSKHLVRGETLATDISARFDPYARLRGLFLLSAVPAQGHEVAELEQAIVTQIKRLQEEPVSGEELKRVKAQLISSKVFELDSLFYQAYKIGMLETVGVGWRTGERYMDEITAITPEQIQAAAREFLVEDGLTVGVLEPQPLPDPSGEVPAPPAGMDADRMGDIQ